VYSSRLGDAPQQALLPAAFSGSGVTCAGPQQHETAEAGGSAEGPQQEAAGGDAAEGPQQLSSLID
jgi:hypothetical protein